MKIDTVLAPNPGAFTLDGTRSYVLAGSFVVDPGPSIRSHVDALIAHLATPTAVLLTHRHADHVPAAADLRERLGMQVWGPAGVGIEIDRILSDGDVVDVRGMQLAAIETPGHTPEHICFLSDAGDLFTGDMVLGEGTTVVLPPDGDMGDYVQSLERLRALPIRRVWPGHGPMREDAVALIDGYIAHRRAREAQVYATLRSCAATVGEIRRAIYPDIDVRLHGAAESQIEAHLIDLERRGRIRRSGSRFSAADAGE